MNNLIEDAKNRLIVALDYSSMPDIEKLVEKLGESISIYKVGLESYLNTEGKVVDYLHQKKKKIFILKMKKI